MQALRTTVVIVAGVGIVLIEFVDGYSYSC